MRLLFRLLVGGVLAGLLAVLIRSPRPLPVRQPSPFEAMVRDPATGTVPAGVRARERAFVATLPKRPAAGPDAFFDWTAQGPHPLAGRTRAVAVSVDDPATVLAGAVSGGIWKSTDGGQSWRRTSEVQSVTSLAQDPRPGHTDTWYAGGGELLGSTRGEFGIAPLFGDGIHKSTDGGETWARLPATAVDVPSDDVPFTTLWRLRVSPATGSVFVAANGFGVYRSADEGVTFEALLGTGQPMHVEVAVSGTGTVLAVLSSEQADGTFDDTGAGLFVSDDDGVTWARLDAPGMPANHRRSVAAFAPSDPDVAYVFTDGSDEKPLVFQRVSVAARTAEDRSANLPVFDGRTLNPQGGYDMALAVKPDDPDFVLLAGLNLWRSRDGFATRPTDETDTWISAHTLGDLCVDFHEITFDPGDPSRAWIGCDQGLYTTPDVTARQPTFQDANDGYDVAQFYAAAMSQEAGNPTIVGGMQDWGSVTFSSPSFASLLAPGDGGQAYVGERFAYSSLQFGRVYRHAYSFSGEPLSGPVISTGLSGVLFTTPFAVDPADERVMFYPVSNELWRSTNVEVTPSWRRLEAASLPLGYFITALAASHTPAHVLYYAGWHPPLPPLVFRLDDATGTAPVPVDVSVPGLPAGTYPAALAVNPLDAGELLVVFSNYGLTGLYHSTDFGATYTAVEGNLTGTPDLPGPSLRTATILPLATGTVYLVGTTAGLFSTDRLAGGATVWQQEGADLLGDALIAQVSSRPSDGRVLVATHGRGIFTGDRNQTPVAVEQPQPPAPAPVTAVQVFPNPSAGAAHLAFTLAAPARIRLALFDLLGRRAGTPAPPQMLAAGRHTLPLGTAALTAGVYAYRLEVTAPDGTSRRFTGLSVRRR